MRRTQIIGVLVIIMVLVLGACSPTTITLPPETITITPPPETITVTPPPETITVTPSPETPPLEIPPMAPPSEIPATFDLAIEQTVSNLRPLEDENVTYTITITNLSSIPASGVVVTDQFRPAAGVTFVSYQTTGGTYDSSTGVWTVGDLAEFTQVTLSLTVRVGFDIVNIQITNCATLTAVDQLDTNSANNSVCTEVVVVCGC